MATTVYKSPLLLLLLFISISISSSTTVWEILPKYGLPAGLLPDSVTSYSLSDDGAFTVELKNPCYIHFDYLVYYDKKITGKLQVGSITNLNGIEVKRFFIWLDVDEIRVDLPPSNSIYFQVGIINKKLSVDQFETVKSCSKNQNAHSFPRQLPSNALDDVELLITE